MNAPDNASHRASETIARSIVKTLSYRVFILALDFTAIYVFTHRISVAVGFTIVSNVYTTIGFLVHERVWDRIKWGRRVSLPEGKPAQP